MWASGVNTGDFDPKHKSAAMRNYMSGGHPELPLVVHVGRLVMEKNSCELPEIIRETIQKMGKANVRFCVVGDGNLREYCEDKCVEYGVSESVVFTGMRRGKDVLEAYASSDVFFSTSTTEAFPLVYLEAMSSGVAVVGPDAGGVPNTFMNGQQGYLFTPHDACSASLAIQAAVGGGEALKDKAYAHGKSFTWARSIGELEYSLQSTLRRKEESGFWGCASAVQ
jgi:glycosyltransferase involved in cell wall biosynthesis